MNAIVILREIENVAVTRGDIQCMRIFILVCKKNKLKVYCLTRENIQYVL